MYIYIYIYIYTHKHTNIEGLETCVKRPAPLRVWNDTTGGSRIPASGDQVRTRTLSYPTHGPRLGSYGGPRGGAVSYERGTPVAANSSP